MAKYGKTWWGQKWLEAFNGIDYSNRLPRGRTYANTGRAHSISVDKNTVKALVDGSYGYPYKIQVNLSQFNKKAQGQIKKIITESPSILSSLLNMKLPASLFNALKANKIKLFPENWKDMDAQCSCPDWAMPCKHIAAIVYLIAIEIDKNPFMIFNIKDCNLLELLDFKESAIEDVQKINTIEDVLISNDKAKSDLIDVSAIEDINTNC